MSENRSTAGIVVIGRNEGPQLGACLTSAINTGAPTVYVDSASTDCSVGIARAMGVSVVELSPESPLSAARGRNAGFEHLRNHYPHLEYVQFIDGDCTLHPDWPETALESMREDETRAIVCGRLRERNRDRSVYNRLCDLEWDRPVGEVADCGGIFMVRASAFADVEGFNDSIPAGEEPELCRRLRASGWTIFRVASDMATHDAAMTHFGQWWSRCARLGRAWIDDLQREGFRQASPAWRGIMSAWVWAAILPVGIVIAAIWLRPVVLVMFALFPIQIVRTAWRESRRRSRVDAFIYGIGCLAAKWPESWGAAQRLCKHTEPRSVQSIGDSAIGRVAYLNTQYPALSHTFIEREVSALRRLGLDVQTFSVRRPSEVGVLSADHTAAAADTHYLLETPWRLAGYVLLGFVIHPWRVTRTIAVAQRHAAPGVAARLRHVNYAMQAVRLGREMYRRGLTHVHVHMANNGAMVALLTCVYNRTIGYSLTIHGSAEFFEVEQGQLKLKAERAVFVRCISDFCRAQVMTWTDPRAWANFHVVHCGVDTTAYSSVGRTSDGPLRLLTVGRMVAIKGYPLLLDACRRLDDQQIPWQLTMVGSGDLVEHLKQQACQLGIGDRIVFPGAVGQDDIRRYFEHSDVMIISSFMEGIPVVLMEAMATQMPVIATNVGGIIELVEHGVNGWVVRAGNSEALADALAEADHDRPRLVRYGASGRDKVQHAFGIDAVARAMLQLFQQYRVVDAP